MNKFEFYHQLGVHLLAKEANLHLGASVCASAFIYEMSETAEATRRKMDERLNEWFGEDEHVCASEVFSSSATCDVDPILSAMEDGIDKLHIIGHDIILGSAALKSLHRLEFCAPQNLVDKIATRVRDSGKAHPGLFYGYSSEDIRKREASFNEYSEDSTPHDVAGSLIEALKRIRKSYFGFHFLAQETHLFTHAEAIISLHRLSYADLFKRSLKGWFLRLKLLEIIDDLNLDHTHKSPKKMGWDPRIISFWDAYDTYVLYIHPIKTMLSYLTLKKYGMFSNEHIQFLEEEKLPYLADSRHIEN